MTRHTPPTEEMSAVLRLMRGGKLAEATALIQHALQGKPVADATPPSGEFLEGTFTRLDDRPEEKSRGQSRPTAKAKRSGLAETLRGIAAGGMPRGGPLSSKGPDVPDGASFVTRTHKGRAASRDYRLYIPSRGTDTQLPVVVMLHGCTQTPEDFAVGTGMNALAEEFGCIVVYPEQTSGANMQKCWNWFRPEDQARDAGEPALLAGLTEEVIRATGADRTRVYVAGLSAGGAAAAILAAAYPDLFSAVGVHSGLPLGAAQDVPSAFAAMRNGAMPTALRTNVPTISFHGLADSTVHPANGKLVVEQALRGKSTRPDKTTGKTPSGRTFRQTRHEDTDGRSAAELWEIEGVGHAWSGGSGAGSYTDPKGPDASREMLRFFHQHAKSERAKA